MGSESHLRRGSLQKASWKPLGTLLEALAAEITKLESLLAALGGLSRQFSPKKESKMGPICTLRFLGFEVPSWGPKLDPILWLPEGILRLPNNIFNVFRSTFGCQNVTQIMVLSFSLLSGIPSRQAFRSKKGGTAVSGRMAFRIRCPTLLASVARRRAGLYLFI